MGGEIPIEKSSSHFQILVEINIYYMFALEGLLWFNDLEKINLVHT